MPKKRTDRIKNYNLKIVEDEKAREKKLKERLERRAESRREQKEELLKKLGLVKGEAAVGASAAAPKGGKDAGGDVEMAPASSKRKGVVRRIGKAKDKLKREKAMAKKAIKAAKARGDMSVERVKRILIGKKKAEIRPDGKERTRDKKLRKKREQRMRRMGLEEESDDESEDADE